MSSLPSLHYSTSHLPAEQAFEEWRELMAPLFRIEHARHAASLPRGSVLNYLLDGVLVNRTTFNAQHISREPKRIAATPDHLVLQYYRSGGFHGEFEGGPVMVRPTQVAVCDLSRSLDVRAANSDTIGLAVPKHLLPGVDIGRLASRLPPDRERHLAAQMEALYRQLPRLQVEEAESTCAHLLAFCHRLFDPSGAADLLEGPEFRMALVELADRIVSARLGATDLTPAKLAEWLGVSRATLYRAFAPLGGVAQYVQNRRLDAVREALLNPLDRRAISQLAAACGFASLAHLSRIFRARYGLSPRAMRREQASGDNGDRPRSTNDMQHWWSNLAD